MEAAVSVDVMETGMTPVLSDSLPMPMASARTGLSSASRRSTWSLYTGHSADASRATQRTLCGQRCSRLSQMDQSGPVDLMQVVRDRTTTMGTVGHSASESGFVKCQVEDKLLLGIDALRIMRVRVSGSMLAAGLVCGITSQLAYLLDGVAHYGWPSGVAWLAVIGCITILGLAPLRNDKQLTQLVLCASSVVVLCDMFWDTLSLLANLKQVDGSVCKHQGLEVTTMYCWSNVVANVAYLCADLTFVFLALMTGPCSTSPAIMQYRMWNLIATYLGLMLLSDLGLAVSVYWLVGAFDGPTLFCLADILGLVVALRSSLRNRLHASLVKKFEKHGAMNAAAGIASLVGKCPPAEALSEAVLRFRAVSIERLTQEDFQVSPVALTPSPNLLYKAETVKLGKCDAFISHSWHDCSTTKWEALQGWRAGFKEKYRREPLVWFDKACIDQNNIEDDLRCLPIFLSGCRYLVIMCGSTYLSRLWCILEIFTFVHMGGNVDRIIMVPIIRQGYEREDRASISDAFEDFDAQQCQCFCEEDKERMLTIIHTAFGDMDGFNDAVREIFEDAGWNIGCCESIGDEDSDENTRTSSDSAAD